MQLVEEMGLFWFMVKADTTDHCRETLGQKLEVLSHIAFMVRRQKEKYSGLHLNQSEVSVELTRCRSPSSKVDMSRVDFLWELRGRMDFLAPFSSRKASTSSGSGTARLSSESAAAILSPPHMGSGCFCSFSCSLLRTHVIYWTTHLTWATPL